MATRINYNYEAAVTYTSLKVNERLMNKSLLRLSTGLRILSAADDASGLFIADQLALVSAGLEQGNRNIQFAISALQIAEGGVAQIYDKLKTMYQKAIRAANDVNDANARAALQRDIENLRDAILKIAQDTEYNGIRLLNGGFANIKIHYGARASQVMSVRISPLLPEQLGGYFAEAPTSTLSGTQALATLLAGDANYTVDAGDYLQFTFTDGTTITLEAPEYLGYVLEGTTTYVVDASAIAEAVNNNVDLQAKNIRARAENVSEAATPFADGVTITTGDQVSFKIYAGGELVFNKTYTTQMTLDEFIADINDQAQGKLIASKDASGTRLVLQTPNGETISVEVTITDGDGTANTSVDLSAILAGITAGTVVVDDATNTTGSAVKIGELTLMGTDPFNVLGNGLQYFTTTTSTTFVSLTEIDVTTNKGAEIAQMVIQSAVSQVDTIRSQIGSLILDLQAIYDAQAVAKDNTDNAENVIRNVDFAKEMTEFTKYQIRMQSGIAMLAQANALPQLVLQLLR